MNVLLVGHRCVGKSTVGALLASELGRTLVDVDDVLEERTGSPAAALVEDDEELFREQEVEAVEDALRGDAMVVSAGAGLRTLPDNALVIWLHRDGWEDAALVERDRLRPELSWADEIEWMCATREPRWLAGAHIHYRTPRGRAPERVAYDLATWVRFCEAPRSPIAAKTWVVPNTASELDRAAREAARFGLAGVEVRSDVATTFRALDVPVLASVRTDDEAWIDAAVTAAAALDVDLAHLDAFVRAGAFSARPRPLAISAHPLGVDPDDVTALASAARRIQVEYPAWAEGLSIKYAPQVSGFADVGLGRAATAPLRRAGIPTTYLPQGAEMAWTRPILAADNAASYVAARMRPDRVGLDEAQRTPWDLQDWVPHMIEPRPTVWDALLGDPVAQSQGDLWHRRAAIGAGEPAGYVKVRASESDADAALSLLAELGVRGVSITAPHKQRYAFVCTNDATFGVLLGEDARWAAAKAEAPIRTGNTLLRRDNRWLVTDTDETGMAASLAWLEQREVGPATIALFGGGGVGPALVRAIDESDWFLVYRCRARAGWPDDAPPFVTVVVNAAGPLSTATEKPPRCRAWVDLHYADVAAPPTDVVHLIGDVFFDAQAEAQRAFWRSE